MSKANDILREQAVQLAVDYRVSEAKMYYAVADLMDAISDEDISLAAQRALAALKRAITGESDAEGK